MSILCRTAATAVTTCAAFTSTAPAQSNDSCSSAAPISGYWIPIIFDTSRATTDGAPNPACAPPGGGQIYKDVWFCWQAYFNGPTEFTTCLGQTNFDTKIAVYDGCSPCPEGSGGILGCNDDDPACGLQSRIVFNAVRGHSYLLRIGGPSPAAGGTGAFTMGRPPCPCDWNGDGVVNSRDFFDFIFDFWNQPPDCLPCLIVRDFFDFFTCFFTPPADCH